jgi:hypothetical protein
VSDERAFTILRSRRWTPQELHTAAQRELSREQRVANLQRKFADQLRDPMTMDLVGWDEHQAKGTNWPWCHKCKAIVRGFGVEDRETDRPTIVAKCHGQKQGIQVYRRRTGDEDRDSKALRYLYRHLVFFAG